MIHTTIGVYPNGSHKVNGVKSENIASHIDYNLTMRPGRTLIVDGYVLKIGIGCIQKDADRAIDKVEKKTKDTQHYV